MIRLLALAPLILSACEDVDAGIGPDGTTYALAARLVVGVLGAVVFAVSMWSAYQVGRARGSSSREPEIRAHEEIIKRVLRRLVMGGVPKTVVKHLICSDVCTCGDDEREGRGLFS